MKNTTIIKKALSLILSVCLIAAIGLTVSACADGTDVTSSVTSMPAASTTASSEPGDGYGIAAKEVGQGSVSFIFRVTDQYDTSTLYRIYTDEKTVGAALQKLGMISGEESQYGLYVKTVNGITADYDTDKAYWAFYIDNEMAPTGVEQTQIVQNTEYCLKYTKE